MVHANTQKLETWNQKGTRSIGNSITEIPLTLISVIQWKILVRGIYIVRSISERLMTVDL